MTYFLISIFLGFLVFPDEIPYLGLAFTTVGDLFGKLVGHPVRQASAVQDEDLGGNRRLLRRSLMTGYLLSLLLPDLAPLPGARRGLCRRRRAVLGAPRRQLLGLDPHRGVPCRAALLSEGLSGQNLFGIPRKIFLAFPDGRVYTGRDESHSSLKGIARSRDLPTEEDGLSMRATLQKPLASPSPFSRT